MLLLEVVQMLLNTAAALLGGALLLRVYLSWLRIAGRNPLFQLSWALTEWLVKPFRALLPGRARIDWACLAAALAVALAFVLLMRLIGIGATSDWALLVPQALGLIVHWALYMLTVLVFIYVLLSLVNPHAPLAPTFDLLTRPLLAPFRRVLPPIGGFDLSPIAFLLVVQILLLVLDSVHL
ncbi:MAG TPA: YggT family protein [Burkholderiaceae bacterium]|nr:YggT family protein [Burkholderiaceae bacterium]